ncbi:MAG TPA: SPFH domain-containing protein [Anaerolineae bacterium]|nr:SPFH domain-containing protein [Anaerolineae bacterium]HQH38158.1 SPFH domain-containing protein [Anaerolineae bacterium]
MHLTKHQRADLISLVELVFSIAFITLLFIAYIPEIVPRDAGGSSIKISILVSVLLVGAAFFLCVQGAKTGVQQLFVQFAQHFFDLSWDEAADLIDHLLYGLPQRPPKKPLLRVYEGQTDPDGPTVMYKVGGPGFLSIAHDSAVVTSKLGRLCRVLGPGFYELAPFERVWDVVDLRPQRRSLRVEFMTLDGIPAYCDVEIRFRVANSPGSTSSSAASYLQEETLPSQAYPFNAEAVLQLTTSKYIKSRAGSGRVQDWRYGLVNGALDGFVRDRLEQYTLDDFINPRYWAMHEGGTVEPAAPPPVKPTALKETQKFVEEQMAATAKERGLVVESVQLMPVQPAEEAISRQWLEFWQAKLQRNIDLYTLDEEAKRADLLAAAGVEAQVEVINSMLTQIQDLAQNDYKVPSQLIVMSFMEVLRAMADRDPAVQQLMFQQAESLIHIVNAIQKKKTPFGPALPSAARLTRPKA